MGVAPPEQTHSQTLGHPPLDYRYEFQDLQAGTRENRRIP